MKRSMWLSLSIAMMIANFATAGIISTFGEQDFAEGTILFNSADFLAPQTGEAAPIGIHIDPSTFSWTHNFTAYNDAAILTISLWDLDGNFPGNQVTAFSVNGIAQDVSIFEAFQDGDRVHLYNANLAAGLLSGGVANVSITLGNLDTNAVGFDFAEISSISAVPEPSSFILLAGLFALKLPSMRFRKNGKAT